MPDQIERLIYKTEIDDAGYIKGLESLSASTKKFTENQEAANKTLKTNEAALKANSERLEKARKDLENYAGTNARYRKQLEGDVKNAEKEQVKLTQLVNENKTAYDAAAKAAQNFANITAKAGTTTRIGTAPIVPPVAQTINATQLTDLPDIVNATKGEFDALRVAIEGAETHLSSLDKEGEEFKEIAPIVAQAKDALNQFDQAARQSTGSTVSLRTQILRGREELVKLEQAGKGATKEYFEMEKHVAHLTSLFNEQQARIRVLASEHRALDFGKAAITSAIAGFEAYTSVTILAGEKNEELEKKVIQLFAAMRLLASIEEVVAQLKRGGVLITNLQSASLATYTAVVGASTGALRAFRLALLATGIGAAVIAIGFLVSKYNDLQEATKEAAIQEKFLSDINIQASESVAKVRVELNEMQTKLRLAKEGLLDKKAVLKEYNEGLGKVVGTTNDLNTAEQTLIDKAPEIIQLTFLKAKAQAAGELAIAEIKKAQAADFKSVDEFVSAGDVIGAAIKNTFRSHTDAVKDAVEKGEKARQKEKTDSEKHATALLKIQSDLTEEAAKFAKEHKLIFEPTKEKKAIESDFQQRKAALLEQISKLANSEFETEVKIRREFKAKLDKEKLSINKDKSLKKEERTELISLATTLNKGELDKAIADYKKKVTDARKKLNKELNDIQDKYILDNLNLINEEFERRAAIIDFNEKKAIADAKENTQERLDSLELDRFLLGEQNYQDARAEIVGAGEQAVLNITQKGANERQKLAADIFKNSLDLTNQIFEDQLLQLDENTAEKIQQQKALLSQGTINYDEFQKAITKILKDEKAQRDKIRLEELNAELKAINDRIKAVTNAEEKAELQKRQRAVRGQIAEINSQTNDVTDPNAKKVDTLQAYVTSIGQLADSVVSFWQKANEAESAALDRSISLQEKRVSAAQRIAERGNASYLKAEEDRLNELTVKRENAARKQLGIDAALQASQILVGITGAISKIATPGIGIAETIGAMAVIFSSLAAGYGLVKSLQGNQPKLFKGTRYLKRNGEPAGVDTIPAMLNEGEAVIPTDKNKAYHPTVAAIYDGTIPPEHINNFVKNYHKIKSVPQPDYGRIKESAEMKTTHDSKLAVAIGEQNKLLIENNDLQRQHLRAIKAININASIDRDGVAIMVNEYIEQQKIAKKI